jgi:hypothetical protein
LLSACGTALTIVAVTLIADGIFGPDHPIVRFLLQFYGDN